MSEAVVIGGVSVAHQRASVAEIEAATGHSQQAVVSRLLDTPGVSEAFVLQTCNRAEAYVAASDGAAGRDALSSITPEVRDGAIDRLDHEGSIRHLMRVASGLESLVVGEDQILGQFKRAIEDARTVGGLDGRLGAVVQKAAHVGERARAETGINEGTVSLGSAAVALAQRETTLADRTALVVGAGEIGTLVARRLDDAGLDTVLIANRTVSTANHVAAELDAEAGALSLGEATAVFDRADVVFSATGAPGHVFSTEAFADTELALCVDLAQPRDVPPAAGDHVPLCDIDDLEAVTDQARADRADAVAAVERLIGDEFDRLLRSFKRDRADEAISVMYAAAERVRDREVQRALTKLDSQGELNDAQRDTVESMADALVGQLLAAPTKSLREAAGSDDWETIHTAMELFDPGFDQIDADRLPSEATDEMPDAIQSRIDDEE